MQLPDYAEFAEFKNLRQAMQASKDGTFELFDANKHLTGEQRSKLELGIRLDFSQIHLLRDATWRYKNSRIMLYTNLTPEFFHIANCEILVKLQKIFNESQNSSTDSLQIPSQNLPHEQTPASQKELASNLYLLAFTNINAELASFLHQFDANKTPTNSTHKDAIQTIKICKHCLQALKYKGFDMLQNRKLIYNENLLNNFTREDFFNEYKMYPLTANII